MVEIFVEEICCCVVLDVNEICDEFELSIDVEMLFGEFDVILIVFLVFVGVMFDDDILDDDDEVDDILDDVILVVVLLLFIVDDWVLVDVICGVNIGIFGDRIGVCRVGG